MTARARDPQRRQHRSQTGFTLVELMIVVFMIGVLSSLIGAAYMRNVKRSRTTEAVGHLQKMWVGAIAYYETDHAANGGTMLSKQFPGDCNSFVDYVEPDCCLGPGAHCPGNDAVYQDMAGPFPSIGFNIPDQHLYMPHYGACPDPTKNLWIEVWGDLNCDTTYSKFTRMANVGASGDVEGYLTPAVLNEVE
jgi:prepilin-type N-terminal cleavage/methylation domain-containing protein